MSVLIVCEGCGRSWHDGDEEDRLHYEHGEFECPHRRKLWKFGVAVAVIYSIVVGALYLLKEALQHAAS